MGIAEFFIALPFVWAIIIVLLIIILVLRSRTNE